MSGGRKAPTPAPGLPEGTHVDTRALDGGAFALGGSAGKALPTTEVERALVEQAQDFAPLDAAAEYLCSDEVRRSLTTNRQLALLVHVTETVRSEVDQGHDVSAVAIAHRRNGFALGWDAAVAHVLRALRGTT